MPAVTVDDITVLPRIPVPDPVVARERQVLQLTTAPSAYEGDGFPVRRAFAGVLLEDLDPFIHLDQMGEVEYAPGEAKGTPWHPHRGFETVTYMLDGVFEHNDSNGGGGLITNGDTQWMTAGAGILHIEKPPEWLVAQGGLFHGFQLWVNLPRDQKLAAPRYQDIRASEVALASSPDGGALVRVIAGEVAGHPGPGSTYTPMTLVHATLSPGATLQAAVARRLQRARVRPRGPRHDRRGAAAGEARPAGGLRARRHADVRGRPDPGEPRARPRRADPRRAADPRARGLDGAVRHEHPRGGPPGVRGRALRPAGHDPGRPLRHGRAQRAFDAPGDRRPDEPRDDLTARSRALRYQKRRRGDGCARGAW